MNKAVTKQLLSEAGINNSPFQTVTYRDYIKGNLNFDKFDFPVVAKPNSEGSSIAVSIIETREELEKYFSDNLEEYKNVLVEKFIRGREITVGIIGCEELTVLPILELKPHNKFYDYEAKYTPGMTDFIIPADFPVQVENKIKTMAEKAHKICHCHGVSRVDMIVDENNIPYILEINTSPGMTDQSDLPAQAKAAGINFEQLVEIIMRSTD
jgi:D-alanine-D-alanine ligase